MFSYHHFEMHTISPHNLGSGKVTLNEKKLMEGAMFHFHDYGRKGSDFHCMKLFHHDSTHWFRNSTSSRGGSVSLAFYGQHPRSATDWHDTRGPQSNCTTRPFPVRPGFSSTQSLSGMLQISPENLTDFFASSILFSLCK